MSDVSDDFDPEELALLRGFFRDEAVELLERMTTQLTGPSQRGQSTELLRATHTLKGSAGAVGLGELVDYAHRLESAFAKAGSDPERMSVHSETYVRIVDELRHIVDGLVAPQDASLNLERARAEVTRALAVVSGESISAGGNAVPEAIESGDDDTTKVATISDAPAPPSVVTAAEVAARAVSAAHNHTATANEPRGGDAFAEIAEMSDTRSIVTQTRAGSAADYRGEHVRIDARRIDGLMNAAGELVFDRTRIERRAQHLRTLAKEIGRSRQRLRDEIGSVRGATRESRREEIEQHLRSVETDLAALSAQIAQATTALLDDTEALRRTTASLQEDLTRVRMASAGALFRRLGPQVRSIARSLGKRVRVVTEGAETEFDKLVADQVADPIVQLLRNAIAHGIESAEVRLAAGKSAEGTITLAARPEGSAVCIEVRDDGAGIDPNQLRAQFVASGSWTQERASAATDDEVLRAIFDAGTTSRDEADEFAGRGVGLDAVRESIARLGGEIRMTSTPARGTSFTLWLPVSTSMAVAMLFKIHGQVYALPNVHVAETQTIDLAAGDRIAQVRGQPLPLVRLPEVLGPSRDDSRRSAAVIVIDYAGRRFAMTCDRIVGPREIVVKHLGPLLSPLPLYAGATISGSGKVQLILDPAALVRLAFPEARLGAASSLEPIVAGQPAGRLLVADDSRAIREAMTRILSSEGFIVDVAEDGARAWEMARQLRYDLIITDIEMPNLDGLGLIAKLQADERLKEVPLLCVSSRSSGDNRDRVDALGVRFVPKPVTRRRIVEALTAMGLIAPPPPPS